MEVLELLPPKPPQYVDWASCRVAQHEIQFHYEEECPNPSSLDQVDDARLPEKQAWKLSRGSDKAADDNSTKSCAGA